MNTQVERSKFITDLLAEVDGFDEELFPSIFKMEPKDTVVGMVPVWTRKVYALMRFTHREMQRMKVEMDFDPGELNRLKSAYGNLDHKYDTLKEILWGAIRQEFNAWGEDQVGIREGWKAVTSPMEDGEMKFRKFLGGIFGQLE